MPAGALVDWANTGEDEPSAAPARSESSFRFMASLLGKTITPGSHTQQQMQPLHLAFELGHCSGFDDPAMLHDQVPVRERRGETEVLLDHDDRVAALLQAADHRA